MKDEAVRLDPARFADCADLFRDCASTIQGRAASPADRLELVQRLESAVGFLERAAATCSGTAILSKREAAWRCISSVLLRNYIKSSWKLPEVLSQSAGVLVAGAGLESGNPGATARSTISVERDTFRVDLAFTLLWRNRTRRERCAKWTWQDASPQGGFNWLLTRYKWCRLRDIIRVVQAQTQLMSTVGGVFEPKEDNDFEPLVASDKVLEERRKSNEFIAEKVGFHQCVPGSMGQGHTALEDKASTSTHQYGFDAHDLPHLARELDEIISGTTDMGVEIGTAEFHTREDKLQDLLPGWFFSSGQGGEMGDDGADLEALDVVAPVDQSGDPPETPEPKLINAQAGWLRRNEIPIPGVNHLLDSITRDAHHSMPRFKHFLDQLHVVEQLLADHGRRERFVATCLLGTPLAEHIKVFRTRFFSGWVGGCLSFAVVIAFLRYLCFLVTGCGCVCLMLTGKEIHLHAVYQEVVQRGDLLAGSSTASGYLKAIVGLCSLLAPRSGTRTRRR